MKLSALSCVVALAAAGCVTGTAPSITPAERWVGTWGTAPQLVEPANMPPAPGLAGNTLRQVMRVSIGTAAPDLRGAAGRVRVRLSNAFGDAPLVINAARLARSVGGSAIDTTSVVALRFAGQSAVTIPAGGAVISDAFDFTLAPRTNVALTMHFGAVPSALTGHPGSRTTSYLQPGNAVDAAALPAAIETVHWYVMTGIDVVSDGAAALVVIGNSITDGRGSTTDRQNRWPDELANRLHAQRGTAHIAVLNQGIGGNCVVFSCLGPAALQRFERDVLGQAGARWLIILEGVNDIGRIRTAQDRESVVQQLVAAYQKLIAQARARGMRVYGATIMPFGGSNYDRPESEAARQTINAWIRTSGSFDAVIDTDAALRDPAQPTRLLPAADTGDHLHPNELGHRMIAEAVNLRLFGP
jgi:lysophospholipase L1-like esterase